jgi:hypothetical protein
MRRETDERVTDCVKVWLFVYIFCFSMFAIATVWLYLLTLLHRYDVFFFLFHHGTWDLHNRRLAFFTTPRWLL